MCGLDFFFHIDQSVNDICESFNQHIKEARDKQVLTRFEILRRQMVCIFHEKREWILKCKNKICPKIVCKLDISKKNILYLEELSALKYV